MAQFPCEHSNHPFKGRALYFYPALMIGQDADRRRYRLCPLHAGDAFTWLSGSTELQDEANAGSYDGQVACPVCHEPVHGEYRHFFCTAFVEVDNDIVRRDFWAPVHLEHLPQVWDAFQKRGQGHQAALRHPLDPIGPRLNLTGSRAI